MTILKAPEEIFREFEAGKNYKAGIGLFENYERNEAFYIGDQWAGVDAPNMPKPVLNYVRRVVSMSVAKITTEGWGVSVEPNEPDPEREGVAKMLVGQIEKAIEYLGLKPMTRTAERNRCVDGDGCIYFDFDPDAESGADTPGAITAELVENINVYFGNRYDRRVQNQPYIILQMRRYIGDVKDEARENGVDEDDIDGIRPDEDEHQGEHSPDSQVTVLLKLWKEGGTVKAVKVVNGLTIRKEWDTGLKLYPLAWYSWELVKGSYHGRAMLTGLLPNQIAINKTWAAILYQIQKTGFASTIIDRDSIPKWDGTPGKLIEVRGSIAAARDKVGYLEPAPIPSTVISAMDSLASATRDTMGASDATMGNVNPDNASAIIALQQQDEQPLELSKQGYHDFVEDCVRIIADQMRAGYGKRTVQIETKGKGGTKNTTRKPFDFGSLGDLQMAMKVTIGASSLWSEQMTVQLVNNLFASSVMQDPAMLALYCKVMPDKYLPGKTVIEDYAKNLLQQSVQQEPMGTPTEETRINPTIPEEQEFVPRVRAENTTAQP